LILSLARSKLVRGVRSRHVECTSLSVEFVLAVVGGSHSWIAGFDAELVASDEIGPVWDLEDFRVVFGRREVVGEHETAEWVSCQVSTVGIKFTPGVFFLDTNTALIE
jgi:hypothetical protein